MAKSTKKTQQKNEDEIGVLTLNHVALILTILDKEAHNIQYFKRMSQELDSGYEDSISEAQLILAAQITEKNVEPFLEINSHLEHLFKEYPSLPFPVDMGEFAEKMAKENGINLSPEEVEQIFKVKK